MNYRKDKEDGRNERLEILRKYEPKTNAIYNDALKNYPPTEKEVAHDDILDALAAAVTAKLGHKTGYTYRRFPPSPNQTPKVADGDGVPSLKIKDSNANPNILAQELRPRNRRAH